MKFKLKYLFLVALLQLFSFTSFGGVIIVDVAAGRLIGNNSFNESATMNIYNLTGQVLYNATVEAGSNIEINTSSFENGIYIVKLKAASGEEITKKVLISH